MTPLPSAATPASSAHDAWLLALETSGRSASVALARGAELIEMCALGTQPQRHAAALLPTVDALLTRSGVAPRHLGGVAFSQGPGSFTGLRVAATFVRMLHLATGVPALAVPTLAALATRVVGAAPGTGILALMDARRDQCFAALYESGVDGTLRPRGAAELVDPLGLVGLLPRPLTAIGVPATRLSAALAALGVEVDAADTPVDAALIASLGREMLLAGRICPAEQIVPLYVRPPECEEVYEQRRAEAIQRRQTGRRPGAEQT